MKLLLNRFVTCDETFRMRTLTPIPTILETHRAAKWIKGGKAPGACGIYPEYIRYGGHTALTALNELFVQVWKQEVVPCAWR